MIMRYPFVVAAVVYLLLIIGAVVLASEVGTAALGAQAASTPTPQVMGSGYTNYSGYYRMRCWPACHTKDHPESMGMRTGPMMSRPTPEAEHSYTNYSGYYRMRCWPACHTKDFPESIKKAY